MGGQICSHFVATHARLLVFSGRLAILSLVLVLQSSESPQPGDLIEIFRLDYKHWAVYVGDGYVVHLLNSGEHDLLTHQLVIDNCEQKHRSLLDLLASVLLWVMILKAFILYTMASALQLFELSCVLNRRRK